MNFSKKERKALKRLSEWKDIEFLKKKYSDIDVILDALSRLSCVRWTRTDDNWRIYAIITNIGEHNRRMHKSCWSSIKQWISENKRLFWVLWVIILILIYIIFWERITNLFDWVDFIKSIFTGNS